MKSSTFCRSLVGVIDPMLMSQRPFQPPAVMTSHAGVSHAMSTPSLLAISVATSMSKPSYFCSLGTYFDCGGYAGSVDTVSTPLSQICANRSSLASVVAQTVSPVGSLPPGESSDDGSRRRHTPREADPGGTRTRGRAGFCAWKFLLLATAGWQRENRTPTRQLEGLRAQTRDIWGAVARLRQIQSSQNESTWEVTERRRSILRFLIVQPG